MPFYTYTCPDCGHQASILRKVAKRDDPTVCPAWPRCAGKPKRDIAGPAFALKGKGWAKDGYGG